MDYYDESTKSLIKGIKETIKEIYDNPNFKEQKRQLYDIYRRANELSERVVM